jgi:Cof subfamily protein (haloacid dehalogenase superfamily)
MEGFFIHYKLVAADMDGTLLDSNGGISAKTIAAIKKAAEKNVIFTVCTGRPIQGVEKYSHALSLDVPFITYNGAMIVMGRSKEIIYQQDVEPEDARSVLKIARELGTTFIVWSNNKLYASTLNDKVHSYKQLSGVEPIKIEDDEMLVKQGITKLLWINTPEELTHYQDLLKSRLSDSISYYTSKPTFLEFVNSKVSKAVAMEKLGEHFGIRREEMIAVGDGYNDLSMIEYAGLGVAMENAPDEIKAKADFVTLSNDNDGIAYLLEKFIFSDGRN